MPAPPPASAPAQPDLVVISSDDEEGARTAAPAQAVAPLPHGFVLAPIRNLSPAERRRPERIATLREVLATRGSRRRSAARPSAAAPTFVIASRQPHTGHEPVEPGVYRPIRTHALLPHERLSRREDPGAAAAAAAPLPPSSAGRLLRDGTVSVDDVDDSAYAASAGAERRRMEEGGGSSGGARAHWRYIDEGDSSPSDSSDGASDGSPAAAGSAHRTWWGPAAGIRDGFHLRAAAAMGFPPHMAAMGFISHHMHGHRHRLAHGPRRHAAAARAISAFDFFPGEDLGDLLSFLDASAPPPPPSRPLSPAPPLRLSKQQEELAALPAFSRRVPDANFRDAPSAPPDAPPSKALEIVCIQCADPLTDRDNVWATPCGHVMCSACVAAIAGSSKACAACKRRFMKKGLVQLYT
ncbi:hypothetical protein GGI04_001508 [Coemansia thaxteri]|uniref:RING-type domain-containing protein n=1 Tax=Coemansia thaxteri TaxID=2663907 RepID=A0A9W8EFU4_9FUNG|nr:hypothetical protein H4R26_002584 [Coemansia thaxteri]KAJ2007469.1 hypothetical protein GGI04_001508 [Coemansia thaxteri]KAJ2474154.1 hypothetical protein GGI02_000281 [Coemansia sp. RSA 2322]KAJ2484833.1 hypothetical protein EV174_002134 [Coemansia sp. RSA 2320]